MTTIHNWLVDRLTMQTTIADCLGTAKSLPFSTCSILYYIIIIMLLYSILLLYEYRSCKYDLAVNLLNCYQSLCNC